MRWLLQFVIGGILLASAAGKALDLPGFVDVLRTYQAFHEVTLLPLASLITGVEALLAIWLLTWWRLRTGALAAAGLNTAYALWMLVSLLRGRRLDNCGCFGVFFPQPLTWASPIEDLTLVCLCYLLSRLAPARTTEPHPT